MTHMTAWVHRYGLRDLLDDSLDLFKESAVTLLAVGLLPFCLLFLYTALMRTLYLPGNLIAHMSTDAVLGLLQNPKVVIYLVGYGAILVVAGTVGYLAQFRVVMGIMLGTPCSIPGAFRRWMKPFFSLVFVVGPFFAMLAAIFGTVAAFIGLFVTGLFAILIEALSKASEVITIIIGVIAVALLVVLATSAMLIAGVLFLSAPVVLAYEHTGPFAAMSRSFTMATKNFRAGFTALYVLLHFPVVFLVLMAGAGMLLYLPFKYFAPFISGEIIASLLIMLFSMGCTGLLACIQSLAYVDGRCRSDAFDLQLLAADIGLGDEFAQAMASGKPAARKLYPDYGQSPGRHGAAITLPPAGQAAAFPDYSAPPPPLETPDAPAVPSAVAPDYSAPPPEPAAPSSAVPDYSAPPPPQEERDAP